jgi:WhiB family transcriptional regulator, redox-sensing transcriptional regulator
MTWRDAAACRGMDRELFYPTGTYGRAAIEQEAAAKAVCAECPVAAPCLAEALAHRDGWGVFGGTTAEERAQLLRKQRTPKISYVRHSLSRNRP